MKYLLYYNVNSNFVSDQVKAGGDGSKVVSVVDGVAWSNDIEKIHYRYGSPNSGVEHYSITVHYIDLDGNEIAQDDIYMVDTYAGKTAKYAVTPKEIPNYTTNCGVESIYVSSNTEYTYVYNDSWRKPLTFRILSAGTINWKYSASFTKTISYSKDNGATWSSITSTYRGVSINVNAGDKVMFKGDNPSYARDMSYYNTFSGSTAIFNLEGNIMSLIDSTGFTSTTTLQSGYTFYGLFDGCVGLISAENFVLPVKKLVSYCYASMFSNCTYLTKAPELPATTLASTCYQNMFAGCTNLTTAPELPARTLVNYCYSFMFAGCTSLTTAPELPATTLASNCYRGMFNNCTSLTKAPALPATALTYECYRFMFSNCRSLTTAPELPATTLTQGCYYSMFSGCSSLNYIKCLAADVSVSACTYNWVSGVSENGTFIRKITCVSWPVGPSGIPVKWDNVTNAITLSNNFINIPMNGDGQTISIWSYGAPWAAETVCDWLTVSQLSGSTGKTDITITAEETSVERFGTITFTDGTYFVDLNVEQKSLLSVPLTFNIKSNGVIRWKTTNSALTKTIYFSLNNGETWEPMTSQTGSSAPSLTVMNGARVMFKGDNLAYASDTSKYCTFSGSTVKFEVEGNIMSLVNSTGFSSANSSSNCAFLQLFRECTGLTSAENLLLPATSLGNYCYEYLFYSCKNLVKAPKKLPANIGSPFCYYYMFQSCASLEAPPIISLTHASDYSCSHMFGSCSKLADAPVLTGCNNLDEACFSYMFDGCKSLTTAPELPATILTERCYDNMFADCTSLTTAPELPATIMADYCYQSMFEGCKKLTKAPKLPGIKMKACCYRSMFEGCTSLTTAPELPALYLDKYCYESMFAGCTSLTTAPELPATTLEEFCYSEMFSGCTSLTTAPELPAEKLALRSYNLMFYGCKNLNHIKCLATNISDNYCTNSWVSGVSSSGTFIRNLFMSGWTTGINGIPSNWVVEKNTDFGVLSTRIILPESGGSSGVVVYSLTSNWTASTDDEWITLSRSSGLTGQTYVTISASSTNGKRLGNVVFTDGNSSVKVVIDQNDNYRKYLTFDVLSSGTINWKSSSWTIQAGLYYSVDSGVTWSAITSTTAGVPINVNAGDSVMFRGNTSAYSMTYGWEYCSFAGSTAKFKLSGNIMSLVRDYSIYSLSAVAEYAFVRLFNNCTGLTSAENLVLPATYLGDFCYYGMFDGCSGLETAPTILPATALTLSCYTNMFYSCTSLTTPPELPATTLANYCYAYMFNGCTSLTTAPALPATTLASYCYSNMFRGCTSLTTAPALPATTLTYYCYYGMFSGCTSLTVASILSATTMAKFSCQDMFRGCTSLTTAPELPATTLAEYCYERMFFGCTALTAAPTILPSTTLTSFCYVSMFYGCTSLTTAPELPATTLTKECYSGMFNGCTSLNYIKCLATDVSASYCTNNWVYGVQTNSGTFVKNPSMSSWTRGSNGIPNNWTVQDAS